MKRNMGNTDRGIRFIVALSIALFYYFDVIQGALAYVLMGISIILLVTSLIGFCPLYRLLGTSTCKK